MLPTEDQFICSSYNNRRRHTVPSPSLGNNPIYVMALSPEDVDGYMNTLRSGECISELSLKRLCTAVSEILVEESNVQPVRSPVTVSSSVIGFIYKCLNAIKE